MWTSAAAAWHSGRRADDITGAWPGAPAVCYFTIRTNFEETTVVIRLMPYLMAAPIALFPLTHAGADAKNMPAANSSVLATNHCLVSSRNGAPVAGAERFSRSGVFTLLVTPESVEIDESEPLAPGGPYAGTTTWWQFMYPNPGYLPPDRSRLCMRSSGNLSLRTSKGKVIWSSHTAGTGRHNYLTMQDYGNVIVRTAKGKVVWSSRTTRTILPGGSTLASGRHLVYRYRQQFGITPTWLIMRKKGDLVMMLGKRLLWSTRTHVRGAYAKLLPRGNFVVYAPSGRVLWRSRTHGRPSFLELTTGCLTFNTSHGTVWSRPRGRTCSL
jgi:hypothetical protein